MQQRQILRVSLLMSQGGDAIERYVENTASTQTSLRARSHLKLKRVLSSQGVDYIVLNHSRKTHHSLGYHDFELKLEFLSPISNLPFYLPLLFAPVLIIIDNNYIY